MNPILNISPESKRSNLRDVGIKPFMSRAFYIMEIWKDIEGYEGMYQVSTHGRIKSLERKRNFGKGIRIVPERILKIKTKKKGYCFVCLTKGNRVFKYYHVHRLVLIAFKGEKDGYDTNHKNGIKSDNRLLNLEWCTRSENIFHAINIGLIKYKKGVSHHCSKLSLLDVQEIRKLYKTGKYSKAGLGRLFGVSGDSIRELINKNTYQDVPSKL